MEHFAQKLNFGNWDVFAMYLKTHPANPEQMQTKLSCVSWLTVVRFARNIVCHERYWNWTGLLDLKRHFLEYFKSIENIRLFFETYKRNCQGNIKKFNDVSSDFDSRLLAHLSPPDPIQVQLEDVAVVTPLDETGEAFLSVGLQALHRLISPWVLNKKAKLRSILVVSGPSSSGKTTLAKYIIPHMVLQMDPEKVYEFCFLSLHPYCDKAIPSENRYFTFLSDFLKKLEDLIPRNDSPSPSWSPRSQEDDQPIETPSEKTQESIIDSLKRTLMLGCFQFLIVAWDDFSIFFESLSEQYQQAITELLIEIVEEQQKWIFSSTAQFTFSTKPPCFSLFHLNPLDLHSRQSIADAQRLLRFYYKTDKYVLKNLLSTLPHRFCCSTFFKLALPLLQQPPSAQ
eukprot:TRINITY_DN4590_c0_g1_i2.p1 TRINITY_DN4590_c0_g1~~TRINITY_DN4590_c0_g1_i2.p1  ORF type:complete len:398 (-),score=96.61 TRINITY_DN4590_c0_g1_i2:39-1232(-)